LRGRRVAEVDTWTHIIAAGRGAPVDRYDE